MFDRIVSPTVRAAARSFLVVAIVGARQVGKTTLA
jgi:predicted AAA+ superfamily ATPase